MLIDRRALLLLAAGALLAFWCLQPGPVAVPVAKEIGTRERRVFLGRERTRDLVAELRSALAGQTRLITLKVTRHYVLTETVSRTFLGFGSKGTVVITYRVEYALGFDVSKLELASEGGGLVVRLGPPRLVASPAVRLLSHDVPERGLLIDEEAALVGLQQRVEPIVRGHVLVVEAEPELTARSKRSLITFLRAILTRPGEEPPQLRVQFNGRRGR